MSTISDLIATLCPNGVEFKELQEIFITRNGYTPSTKNSAYWTDGTVPWFRMEDIRENGQILSDSLQHISIEAVKGGKLFPANSILVATSATIGEHALITVPHLANQRFTSLILKPEFSGRLNVNFVFYYCFELDKWCLNNTTTSSFASVDMVGFKNFKFPIPPLKIQEKIVKILDKLLQLKIELQIELQIRHKQYSHYRDSLLAFDSNDSNIVKTREKDDSHKNKIENLIAELCPEGVEFKELGEVGEFIRGNGLQKKDFVDCGVGCIHYGQIYTYYRTFADKTKSFISENLARKLRKAHTGDLIIATTSENDEDVCKAVVWLGKEDIAISGDAYIYRHSLYPKYAAYFFQTEKFQKQKRRYITGTKVRRVSGEAIGKILVPVPPLEIQHEIVKILDKFDALVNDLSQGLPAEIAARQQQYEYYRDKLLSFEEISG